MKDESFAVRMTWLHTWSGLFLSWVAFALFLTATISVFWMEITHWAQPELHATQNLSKRALTQYSIDYLQKIAPDSRRWFIYMDDYARNPILVLSWLDKNDGNQLLSLVPDGSGRAVTTETNGGRFFVDFHTTFNHLVDNTGKKYVWPQMLVGAASLAFLIGCITGVIIHRKIFTNFFTFRPTAKSSHQRWVDAHNVLGVLPWPFHVMIIVTGLVFYAYLYIPSGMQAIADARSYLPPRNDGPGPVTFAGRYGTAIIGRKVTNLPPPGNPAANLPVADFFDIADKQIPGGVSGVMVTNPNRDNAIIKFNGGRTAAVTFTTKSMVFDAANPGGTMLPSQKTWFQEFYNVNAGLHFAFFGGTALRLLYFICSAAGTMLIACGVVKFTSKRRTKAHSTAAERFYNFVDRMNVAAIAGSMVACVAYFWALRLLPFDLPSSGGGYYGGVFSTIRAMPLAQATRPDWELYVFYVAWAAAAAHALCRSPKKAWIEQLSLTAILCVALPVAGYLVPNSGLFAMIAASDWITASVDLSSVAIGLLIAWSTWKVSGARLSNFLPIAKLSAAE